MNTRISFDDPPIHEVALGRTFLPREDFLIPYYGMFWDRLRERFPNTEHAAPIVEAAEILNEGLFLPRVWFTSADSTRLVQLQQNRLHYNWRRTDESQTYIRFPTIQAECIDVWEKFGQFVLEVTKQPVLPINAELTYTNLIDLDPSVSAHEIAVATLKDVCWTGGQRFLNAPKAFAHNYTFTLPGMDAALQVTAQAVKRKASNTEALKLELTVKGKCPNELPFKKWSDDAHSFLVQAFKDLTKTTMHEHWKLQGN